MKASIESSRLRVFLGCVVAAGLSAACGDNVVNEPALSIEAFIEGTVTDGVTHVPIAGATITVPGIGTDKDTVDTDMNGYYNIAVPGVGSHTVFVTANDHARAKYLVTAITEPGAAGNIRVTAVRNSLLYPTTGTLAGQVVSAGPRNAVGGARVLVQFSDPSDPIEDPKLTLETTTSVAAGTFQLNGLPAGSPQTRVTVFARQTGTSSEPDTATFSGFVTGGPGGFSLTPDSQNYMTITVDPFVTDAVVSSNVDDAATLASDAKIMLVFARSMDGSLDGTTVTLTDLSTGDEVAVVQSWDATNTTLTITPNSKLVAGGVYRISVTARSVAGANVSYTQGFTVASGAAPKVVSAVTVLDPEPLLWTQRQFRIGWTSVGAEGYRVFARNNGRQTAWVTLFDGLVGQFGQNQVSVVLPDSFNTFPDHPGVFSALGFSTSVEFAVQGFNGKNDGPFPTKAAMFASIKDTVCPTLFFSQGPQSADNTLGTSPRTVTFVIQSANGEFLADASAPVVTFTGTAFDDPIRTDRPDPSRLVLVYEIQPGTNGAGATATADLSAVTDTSENAPDGSATCPDSATAITF